MTNVKLDRRLYQLSAVKDAAGDFASLASFSIRSDDRTIHVAIEDPDPEVADVLADEFMNFALAATIAARG